MEFNDRSAKTKFHVLAGGAVHSSYGNYQDAAAAQRGLPGTKISDNATAAHEVPGFNPAQHTTCDYCAKPATHISRDGGEPYCASCGKANYDKPREALAKLTPKTVRMYGRG